MSDFDTPVAVTPASFEDEFNQAHAHAVAHKPRGEKVYYNPTEDMSGLEKAAAGAGKSVVDIGRSIDHLAGISRLWGGQPPTQADLDEARKIDQDLMSTGAGVAGNIGGTIASTVLPFGAAAKATAAIPKVGAALKSLAVPATYGAAATAGAIQGGVLTPPASEDVAKTNVLGKEIEVPARVVNAAKGAAGGLLGNAAVNTIGRVAEPVKNALSRAGQNAIAILERNGISLDAAQKTGSAFLGRMKASMFDNPFTAGKQLDLAASQKADYNKAILKSIGENADAATPDVMNAAKKRIGSVFEEVNGRNPIHYDNHLQGALSAVEREARSTLNDQQFGVVQRQLENILEHASKGGGKIDGQAAQIVKTQLDRLSGGQDQAIGQSARDIREVMDDALARSTIKNGHPEDYQRLHEARTQWGNMRKIEESLDKEGKGEISPARLANVFHRKANRAASVYGEGSTDLADLAHAGNMILPEKLPQSGTIPRVLSQPWTWPGSLASTLVQKPAQAAMNNPAVSNYISKGMSGPRAPVTLRELLLAPRDNAVVGQARRVPISVLLQNQEQQK